jgi:hypothetical protein
MFNAGRRSWIDDKLIFDNPIFSLIEDLNETYNYNKGKDAMIVFHAMIFAFPCLGL